MFVVILLYVLDHPFFLPVAHFSPIILSFHFLAHTGLFNLLVFEHKSSSSSALSDHTIPHFQRWVRLL